MTKDDLISRQEALDAIDELVSTMSVCVCVEECRGMNWMKQRAIAAIETLPTAEKVGKWIEVERGIHKTKYRCSDCGRIVWDDTGYDVVADYPYCNCGARMRGEEDE